MRTGATRNLAGWILGCMTWCFCCAPAHADGGALLFSRNAGHYRLTVFAAPDPLRAGPLDLSVLVQDSASQTVLLPRVSFRIVQDGSDQAARRFVATSAAATNKLLQSALCELSRPGRWHAQLAVAGSLGEVTVPFDLELDESSPAGNPLWPWLTWPALAVALYAAHQTLVWHKRAVAPAAPRGSSAETAHRI